MKFSTGLLGWCNLCFVSSPLLVALILALVVGAVVMAVAWLAYRPFLSIALLSAVGGVVYLVWKRHGRRGHHQPTAVAYAISPTDDLEMSQTTAFK